MMVENGKCSGNIQEVALNLILESQETIYKRGDVDLMFEGEERFFWMKI